MYEYRKLTPEQRGELVSQRDALGYPRHSPPHHVRDAERYLLTAACYEHAARMVSTFRRRQLLDRWLDVVASLDIELLAWAVLPNHYHLLVKVGDFDSVGQAASSLSERESESPLH